MSVYLLSQTGYQAPPPLEICRLAVPLVCGEHSLQRALAEGQQVLADGQLVRPTEWRLQRAEHAVVEHGLQNERVLAGDEF